MEEIKTVSSMAGIDYLMAKLYRQPERFKEQYYKKEWAAAKNTYDTAVKVYLECVVKRNLGFENERTPPSPFHEYEKSR